MKISLRPVTPEDGPMLVKWRNTPSVLAHCMNKNRITEESNRVFYETHIATGNYKQFIVERMDEDFGAFSYSIATVYLKDLDQWNQRCELCVFTSDDSEWNDESKSIAIRMLLDKAFHEYGMHKVYSYVFSRFFDEAELLKNAGFHAEAVLQNEAKDLNGNFDDVIRFAVEK